MGIRGIRKVASLEIPVMDSEALGVPQGEADALAKGAVGVAGARVRRIDYFVPHLGAGAEMRAGVRGAGERPRPLRCRPGRGDHGARGRLQAPPRAALRGRSSADAAGLTARRRFVELIQAAAGDVDITREDVLVSVGRGFGDQENIAIVEELAQAMGAALSCSRPIADAKWLDKARQVGTSGKPVRPKV